MKRWFLALWLPFLSLPAWAGTNATVCIVTDLHKEVITCALKLPVCSDSGSRVTISRRIGDRFRLIGYGIIKE